MVTYIIIGLSVVASLYAWNNSSIYYRWMFNPYDIRRKKQYYRFITSGLIHLDYMHLIFNMLTLFFFGPNVEWQFTKAFGSLGIVLYLILYFVGMIVADLKSFFQHKNDHNYNSLGASGAVSAVVFSAILFNPMSTIYVYFFPIKAILYAVLYLIYSYYSARNRADNIGHDAHFYGALFGLIFTVVVYPNVIQIFLYQLGLL